MIREKRARGFLVNQRSAAAPLLLAMFDARVLHVVRKGYSAQDEPGERYDVYVIDYGAYVDLIRTKSEPLGTLLSDDDDDGGAYVEVPTQDLRDLAGRSSTWMSSLGPPLIRTVTATAAPTRLSPAAPSLPAEALDAGVRIAHNKASCERCSQGLGRRRGLPRSDAEQF